MKVSALIAGGTGGDINFLPPIPCITGSRPPFFLSSSHGGVFLGNLGGDVPPGSQNPDPISDKKFHFRPKITYICLKSFQIRISSCFLVHLELK